MAGGVKNKRNSCDSNSEESALRPETKPANNATNSKISKTSLLSIQNLQFSGLTSDRDDICNVKSENNSLQYQKSCSTTKERGYDFTSSTNSFFRQMVVTVTKHQRHKHSSVSTEASHRKSQTLKTIKSSTQILQSQKETSQELDDSHHDGPEKTRYLQGAIWRKPCKTSFKAGVPRKFLGTCPPNFDQISKMSKTRQKFFLTQDPRRVRCLVNPAALHAKEFSKAQEFKTLTKMVKEAENVCGGEASEPSEDSICEVIDLENPLQLDFQGLDYVNTYQNDEQDLQNQFNYRKVFRYMERRRVKVETQDNVEQELYQKMINVPKRFDVRDRNEPKKAVQPEIPPKLGELFRSADKPYNQKRIKLEEERRFERYKNLYLKKRAREEREKQNQAIRNKEAAENLPLTLADDNFSKFLKTIEENVERRTREVVVLEKSQPEKQDFPNNMLQMEQFKRMLKQKNLRARDKARTAKEFFLEKTGKVREFPVANLEISSEASVVSDKYTKTSQQSTGDEDGMEVGERGSKFKLRGFHFKMGANMRGKFALHEKLQSIRKEKGCITRDEWLKELVPKKKPIKLDVEIGLQKPWAPDDPNLVLFPPPFGFKAPEVQESAVRNFIEKPLGRHYERVRRKKLKFLKPRLRYKVKKFNLIKYRFGDTAKKISQLDQPLRDVQISKLSTTQDYMAAKAFQKKRRQEEIKQRRLKLLGIPCKPLQKSRSQTKCENSSSSSDSDWVPQQEPVVQGSESAERFNESHKERLPFNKRCNMPAPRHRETTLRQHPRHPRDYDNQRVPSEIFDQTVLYTKLPFLRKLDEDKIKFSNVEQKKTAFTAKFEARHHHDHWDTTQDKQVDVHYQPLVVKPEPTVIKQRSRRKVKETFHMANPPCKEFVDMDLSLPQNDIKQMLVEYRSNNPKAEAKETNINNLNSIDLKKYHKQQSSELKELEGSDFPGHKEYLQFLDEARELYERTQQLDKPNEISHVNKEALIKDLEEEWKSIESCLTSLNSSDCTNLTNDSGSFLLMEGQEKIPLDFIRKSVVPFEELHRSRFRAVPIDVEKEQNNPFQVMPFAGQKKAQLEISTAKDRLFTFNTRLKNDKRLRLEIPLEDIKAKLLGKGLNKHKGLVATDIDETYVEELKNRPPAKPVKFQSGKTFVKDALRLKFESLLIQGQIVRTKIYDRMNEKHWRDMLKVKELYEKLFAKWEKQHYDATMSVVYKVKSFYDETDSLKIELKQLEREFAMLNMDIVFIEGHWVRCIMLQNFHYLMGDLEWRLRHDWLHRLESENRLESFEESIAKRSILNIRKREKDDAWAIKAFYENEYCQNKHENLIVFSNAESFQDGVKNLKAKTFIILLEMHFTLGIHTELQHKLESFVDWCAEDLRKREKYVNRKCAKLYFMDDRAKWLNQRILNFLNEPFEKCFNDKLFYKDRAVIAEAFRRITPANFRSGNNGHEIHAVDMVATIFGILIDTLAKFESIPMDLTHQVEQKLRTNRTYLRKQSYQAYLIERRIDREMEKVVENLKPPYKKPKRTSLLPRYHLKRRETPIPVKAKIITERAKFLFRAFHEGELIDENIELKDSFIQVGAEQEQIVPFYFDHFLKLNGYTPDYKFKTQIELRDGPEIERLQIKSIIPDVQAHMEYWQKLKRKIMDDNIARNPKIYINVVT